MANDLAGHVLRGFEYHTTVREMHTAPPANFARDLREIMACDLMLADLTGNWPDITFTVGLRYMTGRPLICLVRNGQTVPPSLAHVRPIGYERCDLRGSEIELIRRVKAILAKDGVEGRPFFEVLSPDSNKVMIGDFELSAETLADIEDRLRSESGNRRSGYRGASHSSGRYV